MTIAPDLATEDDLKERFTPILERIRAGAAARERDRELPYAEVEELKAAGFTRLTVPVEYGGLGRSVSELFGWLVELAAADSNLPQLLRAHFAFVEIFRISPDGPLRDWLLGLAGQGAVFGNASHENAGADVGRLGTRIRRQDDGWILNGTKYYSTGSLFADWVAVTAEDEEGAVRTAIVPADDPGVELVDDWDGFGQRLTGSGTTVLRDVRVPPDRVTRTGADGPTPLTAFVQLVLLAALAGTARAIAADAADFVRSRTRVYSHGSGDLARHDPLVLHVVGRLESTAFAAEAIVEKAALAVEAANAAVASGGDPADAIRRAELAAVRAQVALIPLVLAAGGELFEVGGASATSLTRQLDRHWRNARTLASHNPAIYQARTIGDHAVNGAEPVYLWATGYGNTQPRKEAS